MKGRTDLTPAARHLLEVLGNLVNGDRVTWPTVAQLAERMNVNRSTIQRARAQLVEAGLITFTPARGRGRANLYALPEKAAWCGPIPEKAAWCTEKAASARIKGRMSATPSIHEVSISAAPVVSVNGFHHPLDPPDERFSTARPAVQAIIAAIRERRYGEIPDA